VSAEIHPAASIGFERAADAYERGRPEFPLEAVRALVEMLGLRPGRTLLELGAGTGKLTRQLAGSGATIVAVEPVAAMRGVLSSLVSDAVVVESTAERLPLGPGDADAAVAAQAFHWFDGDRALAELTRVLPAGAPLALVWNVRDESVPWVRALTDLIEPYRGDTPSHRSMRWLDAFARSFTWPLPARTSYPFHHVTTREAVVDRVVSVSFIAALDDGERSVVTDAVRSLIPPGDGYDEVVFPYRTDVWFTRRA